MDIDALHKQGKCFNSGQFGHHAFECKKPQRNQKSRAVEVDEEEEEEKKKSPAKAKGKKKEKELLVAELKRLLCKAEKKEKKSGTETTAAESLDLDF